MAKKPITISFDVPDHTLFREEDKVAFEAAVVKMLKTAVFETSKNVAENTLFEEFQNRIKHYASKNVSQVDARRMAIEEQTQRILLKFLR